MRRSRNFKSGRRLSLKLGRRRSLKKGGKPTFEEQKLINDSIEDQILIDEGISEKSENTMTIRLAQQGERYMQQGLGYYYYFDAWPGGEETKPQVSQDDEKAFYWFNLAANQHLPESQFYLGEMYEKGRGVEQNTQKALFWYNLSAEQGNKNASEKLSLLS
jgi:hypothetical protein